MKVETTYQCEICKEKYLNEAAALKCEARGPADLEKWKPGLLWNYKWDKGKHGIFALGRIRVSSYSKHNVDGSFWGCRNWSSFSEGGDNFDDQFCNGPELKDKFNSGITSADIDTPEMVRMLSYLKSKGIDPYIMIDSVSYPLEKAREL